MPRPYPAARSVAHLTEACLARIRRREASPTLPRPCLTRVPRRMFGRGTASPLRDHDHGPRSLSRFEVSVHLLRLVQPIAMVDIDLDTPALDRIKQ